MTDKGMWIKTKGGDMNVTCLLINKIVCDAETDARLKIGAVDCFRIYVNGNGLFYGPTRTAKDYAVVNTYSARLIKGVNTIAVLVNSYNAATYCCSEKAPFFYIRLDAGGRVFTEKDFKSYEYEQREKYAQRYSFQRAFVESYEFCKDFNDLIEDYYYNKQVAETYSVTTPELIDEPYAVDETDKSIKAKKISDGTFDVDLNKTVWKDRSVFLVGNKFDGYYKSQLKECISDTVSKFSYSDENGSRPYAVYDVGRNVSGFIVLKVKVIEDCELYCTFDERLHENYVDAFRLWCCNVVKWKLKKGEYVLETQEIYTLRYLQINVLKGKVASVEAEIKLAENKRAYNIDFKCENDEITNVFHAAQNTLAQNSVDYLTDCPSRERAMWLNDVYYSSLSSDLLTGDYRITDYTIECVLLSGQLKELPAGMLPMCYPSEHLNGEYIPNCPVWFFLLVLKRLNEGGLAKYEKVIKTKIYELIEYFKKYINSDGLLEDLDGWIFVEWSQANSAEFVRGVNYPSNMLYYKLIYETARYYNDTALAELSDNMKKQIIRQSFNGEYFEDNRIRENGKLTLKKHISETCQYYAFFSGVATVEEYGGLFKELVDNFGCFRNSKYKKEIDRANIIVGLLMRADIMNDARLYDDVVKEVIKIYGVMAKETGTLWENSLPFASCNHCIASYAAVILLRALTGCKGLENGILTFDDAYCEKYDCDVTLKDKNGSVRVVIDKGNRTIERIV